MSDHNERACFKCGSLLHHEDDCSRHEARRVPQIPVGTTQPTGAEFQEKEQPSTRGESAKEAAKAKIASDAAWGITDLINKACDHHIALPDEPTIEAVILSALEKSSANAGSEAVEAATISGQATLLEAAEWLSGFVEEPDYFPGDGDRAYWLDKRDWAFKQVRLARDLSPGVAAPRASESGAQAQSIPRPRAAEIARE